MGFLQDYLIIYIKKNQDDIEIFFIHPGHLAVSSLDFKHRLKWFILGKHSSVVFAEP